MPLPWEGSDTPFIDSLVKRYPDGKSRGLLIHESSLILIEQPFLLSTGFCQRILHENAFETRNSFDTELIVSQASLLMEVVDDFWRKTFYAAPLELVGFTLDKMNGPEYFCRLLERVKTPDVAIVPDLVELPGCAPAVSRCPGWIEKCLADITGGRDCATKRSGIERNHLRQPETHRNSIDGDGQRC
jgi:hypothetical protein